MDDSTNHRQPRSSEDCGIENPWLVDSLFQFQFFCCPECEEKVSEIQEFIKHAISKHPKALPALKSIKDDTFTEDIDVKPDLLIPKTELISDNELYEDANYDLGNDIKGDFKCSVCEKLFDTATKLSSHGCAIKEQEETNQTKKICLDSESVASNHLPKSKKKLMNCKNSNIQKRKTVTKSEKKDAILHACPECDVKFKWNNRLRMHRIKEHNVTIDPERCLCGLCGKTFVGRSNLKKHERKAHGIDNIRQKRNSQQLKLECTKCSSTFEDAIKLNGHVILCEKISKSFPCPNCDLVWATGQVLNIHLKKDHKIGEIYTCDTCGKCLKDKHNFTTHRLTHIGTKDHVCHICGAGFIRPTSLKYHTQRVHENSGKYACIHCDYKTVIPKHLEVHINAVHTKSVKYYCEDCNFSAYTKGNLTAHKKTVHLKLKPHKCPVCPEAYVRKNELEKHIAISGHS